MNGVITYKDILAARECMERNDVLGFEDGTTVIHNRLLLQACNHDEWQDKRIKELQAQVDRECVWTRVNNSYSCWDEYDAWSTSCGEDYAIEEEWHDKITPYCSNCGGKVIEEQKP